MQLTTGSPPPTKCQQVVLSDLRTALLLFEDRLPWTCVTRAFAASRAAWRKDLSHSASLRQFVRSYTDFLHVRHSPRYVAIERASWCLLELPCSAPWNHTEASCLSGAQPGRTRALVTTTAVLPP